MKYLYLLINFFTIIIPFLFSFHPKLKFYKTWKAFIPAVIITGICFIIWDEYFTKRGVWGFNEAYISGIRISRLPLEEVLFFFCIPYACVFTFFCLDKFWPSILSKSIENLITIILCILLIAGAIIFYNQLYTLYTFASLAILLLLSAFIFRITWLGKFYVIYAVLLIPFLIVNGILTGTGLPEPVVWYNNTENTGTRIFTIPVEDVFYGMELILMNLLIYRYLLYRGLRANTRGSMIRKPAVLNNIPHE